MLAVQSLPGAGWAAWDGDVLLLEALRAEEQLCKGLLGCSVCCVLLFGCVDSDLYTNRKLKSELAVALSITVDRALMQDFAFIWGLS